jgi:hypothetical protein
MVLSDDRKTVVFNLITPFVENERVKVDVSPGLRTLDGENIRGVSYRFATAVTPALPNKTHLQPEPGEIHFTIAGDTLPSDFPPIKIDTVNNPAPGKVFFANFGQVSGTGAYGNYLVIMDNAGKPVSFKKVAPNPATFAYNFTMQPNGQVSYVERTLTSSTVMVLDTTMKIVDQFRGGNGYVGDIVDFRILPNGHAMIMIYDWQIMDASQMVRGAHPAANVCQTIIQELDLAKNVVFQWRSIDYIPITDGYVDSLAASIDYMHSNSFDFDKDGGILISSRHLSEVTKIDSRTGEIMWRLGGKRNQFIFVGELDANKPTYFSYQHDVSLLSNGNILMFDNGNQHTPQYSRIVEYRLDEANKIATLIWEYRHSPDIFSSANGSAQRLPNGNTFIGWGNAGLNGLTAVTEVHPDKSLAFEFTLARGQRSWRAYRLPWKETTVVAAFARYDLLQGNAYWFNGSSDAERTGVKITFNVLQPVFYNGATVTKYSNSCLQPQFSGDAPRTAATRFTITKSGMTSVSAVVAFDATLLGELPDPNTVTIYRRDTVGRGTFYPLSTSYNPFAKELSGSTTQFGEFIFGWKGNDSTAFVPTLLLPVNRDSVNQFMTLVLKWSPKGLATRHQVQVATDSLFRSLVLNDSLIVGDRSTLANIEARAKYYWRVRSFNGARRSAWSPVWSFSAVAPYIAVLSPKAGDVWQRGKSFYVIWHTNVSENLRVDLFRGRIRYMLVKDSVANIGAYRWSIPSTLPPDSLYSIRIWSIKDTLISAFSSGSFAVQTPTGVDEHQNTPPLSFRLDQNYPNPFNPSTSISYQLSAVSRVRLAIYDVLGREVAVLADGVQNAGAHNVRWNAGSFPSGLYICRMNAEATSGEDSFIEQSRKMLLVK